MAEIHARLASKGQSWHAPHLEHAPHLIEVEVCHVLRRLYLSRQMTDLRGRQTLRDLAALGVSLHEHGPLLPRASALRTNLAAYDAMYVALAEGLRAPLLTLDAKLAKTPGHMAKIEVLWCDSRQPHRLSNLDLVTASLTLMAGMSLPLLRVVVPAIDEVPVRRDRIFLDGTLHAGPPQL